jgi:iron(III) transport system permease protein
MVVRMQALAPAPAVVRGPRRRAPGWTAAGVAVAVALCAPLLALPLSFVGQGDALDQIAADLLPEALAASIVLAVGVGSGTLVLGGSLAALVSFYDFPGRRWLDWALVLPMAMPAYVLVFVLLGQYDFESPLQQALRAVLGEGFRLPEVRSTAGTITVLTLVLYPYVYVLGRAAFLDQSRETLEAARTLGLGHRRAVLRVALPLARPALAAGAALAVMEALADFGAVNLLGYRAMTDAIYRVWYGAFDQAAALQLSTVLVGLTVSLLALERLLRGRARYHGALVRGEAVVPRRLGGAAAALATAIPCLVVALVVVLPVAQLLVWSAEALGDGAAPRELARDALNSLLLATVAAVVAVAAAVLVAAARRARPSRVTAAAAGAASLGYAVPGTVVAVAVYVPLAWVDRRLGALVFSGTVLGLLLAYVVRFHALALSAVRSRLGRIDPSLDEAARALGADRGRVLAEVQLPLLYPGLVTAALLVFVEVLKELPATALLRPLGGDTLAIAVWEATKDSRFDTAALPALLIVLVGLLPVVLLMRAARRGVETGLNPP